MKGYIFVCMCVCVCVCVCVCTVAKCLYICFVGAVAFLCVLPFLLLFALDKNELFKNVQNKNWKEKVLKIYKKQQRATLLKSDPTV